MNEKRLKILISQAVSIKKKHIDLNTPVSKLRYIVMGVVNTEITVLISYVLFQLSVMIMTGKGGKWLDMVFKNPLNIFSDLTGDIFLILFLGIFAGVSAWWYRIQFNRKTDEIRVFEKRRQYLERIFNKE